MINTCPPKISHSLIQSHSYIRNGPLINSVPTSTQSATNKSMFCWRYNLRISRERLLKSWAEERGMPSRVHHTAISSSLVSHVFSPSHLSLSLPPLTRLPKKAAGQNVVPKPQVSLSNCSNDFFCPFLPFSRSCHCWRFCKA